MITQVLAKLAGEAMLSLYPMIVKLIHIPMHAQMWTRFSTYALLSALFVDWGFIAKSVVSPQGWMLMLVTLIHVYTSYEGFAYLESGVSYSIFYLYPILILLMAGEPISPWMFLALLGVWVLYYASNQKEEMSENPSEGVWWWWGYAMILIAAFTEAWIYFLVRNLPTSNNWNHVFLSYALGAIGLTVYEYSQNNIGSFTPLRIKNAQSGAPFTFKNAHDVGVLNAQRFTLSEGVGLALGLNAGIGLFGYLLRFYAASRLPPAIYAPLSYFGVFMAYVYGLTFGTDTFSWTKFGGTACILGANYMLIK